MFVFSVAMFKMKNICAWMFLVTLLIHTISAQNAPAKKGGHKRWRTLNGQQPIVIARGGFPGIYPESVAEGIQMAIATSLPNLVVSCNIQLTKDNGGICAPDIRLDNSTTIGEKPTQPQKFYKLNGKKLLGWYAIDFTYDELLLVTTFQTILSRPSVYDALYGLSDPVVMFEDNKAPAIWLNFQHDMFYTQNKLSVAKYLEELVKTVTVDYLSCPEVGFFKNIKGKLGKGSKTKLIFKFPEDVNAIEPTTNKPYSSILKNLAEIKSFANGILVPKEYIWTVDSKRYLNGSTTLVMDAHKEGLEVYAEGFNNDVPIAHNYSYDPVAEYLRFVDNSKFSVDGVFTDFPPTASEAIACFALSKKNAGRFGNATVISQNGASGVYAPCTDLAYEKAVDDGADFIDCSVQMSQDGTSFCLESADLTGSTTVITSPYVSRISTVPEIKPNSSIYTFDLTWSEIQSLKPEIVSPDAKWDLVRNPAHKNDGKFITLSEFLELAKKKAAHGVLINIQNAAYLAKKGLDIIDAVNTALRNAKLDKDSTQKVMIQSDDTSVLATFKNVATYKRILSLPEAFGDAPKPTVDEIKKYANGVDLKRRSIIPDFVGFTGDPTKVVKEMHDANLTVHVSGFRNEFMNIAFDFFSDPIVELAAYIEAISVDGVVTEYPGTADKYLRNSCSKSKHGYQIIVPEAGTLYKSIPEAPPGLPPSPVLKVTDIVDPPLPTVSKVNKSPASSSPGSAPATPAPPPSSGLANVANMTLSLLAIAVLGLFSMGY